MALKNLFGKDVNLDKLPAEIRPLVEQMRQERAAYEALLKRAEPLGVAVAQLEQRVAGLDKLSAQLVELQRTGAAFQEGQKATEKRLVETKMMVEAARGQLETMQGQLKEVLAAKADLPAVAVRLLSLTSVTTSRRARRTAGARPTSTLLITSTPTVNARTQPSKATLSSRGSSDAPRVSNRRTPT